MRDDKRVCNLLNIAVFTLYLLHMICIIPLIFLIVKVILQCNWKSCQRSHKNTENPGLPNTWVFLFYQNKLHVEMITVKWSLLSPLSALRISVSYHSLLFPFPLFQLHLCFMGPSNFTFWRTSVIASGPSRTQLLSLWSILTYLIVKMWSWILRLKILV